MASGLVLFAARLLLVPAVWVAPRFVAPVDAPIRDHFRPPACTWCSGNRGIDYTVAVGTPVRAAASGSVEFAGSVGNDMFVVLAHPDGLRTTYGFLQAINVRRGSTIRTGQIVGMSGPELHFGVRRASTYLDPEPFLRGQRMRARLVA